MPFVSYSLKMFKKYAVINTESSSEKVFEYLKHRYSSENYISASMQAKGYVPKILLTNEILNRELTFFVKARDSLLPISYSGWRWHYKLTELSANSTKVEITYSVGLFLFLMSATTALGQAANEIMETVLAIDALSKNS